MSEDPYAQERENLIEGDPIVVVDELLRLREENKDLKSKMNAGVTVAHNMQRRFFEGASLDTSYLSSLDDAASSILEAMGLPDWRDTL